MTSQNNKTATPFKKLDLSAIDWMRVLTQLGVPPELIENPRRLGPCPIENAGNTRFRLENKDGRGNWFCNHCGSGDGVSLVAKILGKSNAEAVLQIRAMGTNIVQLPERKIAVIDPVESAEKIRKNRQRLESVWNAAIPITEETAAGKYLMNRVPRFELHWLSSSVKFVSELYHFDESLPKGTPRNKCESKWPAMVSKICKPDGTPISIHRTYLTHDGNKAGVAKDQVKKLMGGVEKLNGQAIHLNSVRSASRILRVTEGIENGWALIARFKNADHVWAACTAGNLSRLIVPREQFDEVVIYADHDKLNPKTQKRCGEFHAGILEKRLLTEGFKVSIVMDKREGVDVCDVWKEYCDRKLLAA